MNTFGVFAEDALLGERDEDRAEAASTPLRHNTDGLDIANECASHVEDEKSCDGVNLGTSVCDIDLFDRIGHDAQ